VSPIGPIANKCSTRDNELNFSVWGLLVRIMMHDRICLACCFFFVLIASVSKSGITYAQTPDAFHNFQHPA